MSGFYILISDFLCRFFFTSIFKCENITIKSNFRYCCEIINIKYGMIILPLNKPIKEGRVCLYISTRTLQDLI